MNICIQERPIQLVPWNKGTPISLRKPGGKEGITIRTYDRLMTELQTMRSAKSGAHRNVEKLIDIYDRLAKKSDKEPDVHPFLEN